MTDNRYDVVIVGGAFAGASAALLVRRECPGLRVLVIERSPAFDEKVGEATTEMSGMFLTRRLAQWAHLEAEQLPKEGLRYWWANEQVTCHAEASETGGFIRSTVPSFQLRRDALDEHLLASAVAEGAELLRPVRVRDVEVGDFDHRVTIERDGRFETIGCRWLLDASGRATVVGKQLGLIDRDDLNGAHPTAAIWCRWRGVRHIDDVAARGPREFAGRNVSSRRLATNHYMGLGYWVWFIPLGNGETSVGVVFDKRLLKLHEAPDKERALREHLQSIPPARELLAGAEPRREDVRFYSHLPYVTRRYMGPGWALIGDAAAFLDPYYSPGLDHASFTVESATELIKADAAGEDVGDRLRERNQTFLRSYHRFFAGAFKDKYFYMGESDLLSASFLLDTAQYYIFVVIPAYRILKRFDWMPVLGPKEAFFTYHAMVFYNRRLKRIAQARRAMGEAGRRNSGRRVDAYFALDLAPFRMAARGTKLWLRAELDYARLWWKALAGDRSLARRIAELDAEAAASAAPTEAVRDAAAPPEASEPAA